ncbi:MAG TPA: hypothetical protein VJ738_11295 [Steroidobacteraceae bacterium]|nr:hypothetical protein [Steroidobacteraceae bacterium]
MFLDSLKYHPGLFGPRYARQPDQNDAGMQLPLPEHKLAEILVTREQKALDVVSDRQHFLVRRPAPVLSKVLDAEPVGPKRIDNCFVYALVCNEVHAAESG